MVTVNPTNRLYRALRVVFLMLSFVLLGANLSIAANFTLTQNSTWDTNTGDDTQAAATGDNVNIATFNFTISNASAVKQLDALTGTTGDLLISAATTTNAATTVGSIALTGAASNITITNTNGGSGGGVSLTVTGNTSIGGALTATNSMASANGVMFGTFGGTTAVGGVTTITSVNRAGSTTTMTFTGNSEHTGAVTLTGSANGLATANFNGAVVTFTAGLSLAGGTTTAIANFTPTAAQTVTGVIDSSDSTDRGVINVLSSNLTTFASNIGGTNNILALNVGATGAAGNAKFSGTVDAATITVFTQLDSNVAAADFDGNVVGNVVLTGGNGSGENATASFAGNVTGNITMTPNSGTGTAATFDGTTAQTITGNVVAGADGKGVLKITNTGGVVTFNDDVGVAGTGIEEIHIASGATMTQKALLTGDDLTFDVVTTVDADGAGTRGGTLIIEGGDAVSGTAGGAITLATITTDTALTALTVQGGDAIENDVGGAVTETAFVGATDATTYTVQGGAGGSDGAATGGVGGAVATHLQTGATTATTINMNGGAGGAGVADDSSGVGGAGGAVGSSANTWTGLITATNVNVNGGLGGNGGAGGSSETGGVGGDGGAVTVTDIQNGLTGALNLTAGDGGVGGLGNAASKLGGNGGAGGNVTLSDLDTGGDLGNVTIAAGTGGVGGASGTANGGVGGDGGTVVVTRIDDQIDGNLSITGGTGGVGGEGTGAGTGGNGGAGTAVATLVINGVVDGNVSITSGSGGDGGGAGSGAGNGGTGGAGGAVATSLNANVTGTIALDDGAAGSTGASGTGTAGSGGAASAVTLTFAGSSAQTITGAVTAAADGEGALVLNNSTAATSDVIFSSTIGTSSAALKSITVSDGNAEFDGNVFAKSIVGASGDTVNFDGDVTAATALTLNAGSHTAAGDITAGTLFNFIGASDLTLDGTGDQTITGAITNATGADDVGDIRNSNTGGTVTFASAIGAADANAGQGDLTLDASTTTVFDGALNMEVGVLNGTATFNAAVTLDGAITLGANNKIIVGPDFTNGQTVIAAAGAMTDGDTTIEMRPANLSNGQTITVLDAGSGTTDATYTVIDTALFDFTAALDDDNDTVIVTANKRSTANIASNLGIETGAARALDKGTTALAGAGDAALSRTLNALLVAGGAPAKKAAEQLQNDPGAMTSAGSAAVTSTGTQVIGAGSARMASLRSGPAYASTQGTGFAAGNEGMTNSVWMKPFANWGDQDQRKGIAGFENETFGMAIGGDFKVDNSTYGMSISYANTDVDSKGAGDAQTDIDSYQVTFYGDYTTDEWYVEGLIGYARNEISTSRTIDFASSTAMADYGSNQYMINIGGGMPIEVEKDHYFTPNASFQYTYVDNETYTETGAGSLNLRVSQDEINVALGVLGVRYHTHQTINEGTLTPELRAGLTYDFAGDDGVSTNLFNGGGAAFENVGADVVEFGYRLGGGLGFKPLNVDGLEFTVNYDSWIKEDFIGHNANLQLRLSF